jgi:hypothetical protein
MAGVIGAIEGDAQGIEEAIGSRTGPRTAGEGCFPGVVGQDALLEEGLQVGGRRLERGAGARRIDDEGAGDRAAARADQRDILDGTGDGAAVEGDIGGDDRLAEGDREAGRSRREGSDDQATGDNGAA